MKKYQIIKSVVLYSLIALVVIGCSTKKNTSTTRAYHNLTARYNVYFNGYESLKRGLRQAKKSYKEEYSKTLPVFRYEDKKYSTMVSSEMDLTIKKCAKTIKSHSITAKPKKDSKGLSKKEKEFMSKQEYCKLIDDAYLLMGKAHFYKREFETALQTFLLIVNKYKLESSVSEAQLWIAKTYAETGEYQNAENALIELKKLNTTSNKFRKESDLIRASIFLKQKDFTNAAIKIESALKLENNKKEKNRYLYILAQIYQQDNKFKLAAENYKKVIRINSEYDMTFAANISLAEMYQKSGAPSGDLKKKLVKMIKDEKNIDYLDQLYYAMGYIELGEKNFESAIEYFELSARSPSSGNAQKFKTFLVLANYYYYNDVFRLASAYFDSTARTIDNSMQDYELINKSISDFKELSENLYTVEKEDSVQFLAKLPEAERNKIIDNIIQKIVQKEQEEIQNKTNENSQYDPYLDNDYSQNVNNPVSNGKYYFYNPQVISIGLTDFKKKWGDRKLEDNWRRTNKISLETNIDNNIKTDTVSTVIAEKNQKVTDIKSRDYYLQEIPLTSDKLEESNKRIARAMFRSGELYYKEFNETDKAIYQFEKLLSRFPGTEYRFETLKYLYTIAGKKMDFTATDKYKQLLVKEFPETTYAKMLSNPGYIDSLKKQQTNVENYYTFALSSYRIKKYDQAIVYCNEAENRFPDNELSPNFIYLTAMSFGEIGNKDKLKEYLEILVNKYPKAELAKNAEGTLNIINSKKFEKEIYILENDSIHTYAVIYPKDKIDVNKLKFKFIKLNADSYTQSDFIIDIQNLDNENDIMTIRSFKNSTEAMLYFQTVITKNLFEDIQKYKPIHFVISSGNLKTFLKNKEIAKYQVFFNKNYFPN
ncbi:MAG: tetratricopeptide repeat protein [Bacteroidales bacterium]